MQLLKEYDFDALPYIDKEYDNPMVQDAVHSLISAEMRSFNPGNYLAHLKYPDLKIVSTPSFQMDIARIQSGNSMGSINMSRFNVEKPEGVLEKDVQAWRKSISSAKCIFEHQSNRLMNLEIADESIAPVWLHHNNTLEAIDKSIHMKTNSLKRSIDEINFRRKSEQELALEELHKSTLKRDQAIYKSWHIKSHCDELENKLKKIREENDELAKPVSFIDAPE
eukprot:gene13075-27596_t